MILKLDPRWPLVWRSPSSLQLGIDPPLVVLDQVTVAQEHMLAALAVGVSDTGLAIVAGSGMSEVHELLALVAPALLATTRASGAISVAISGGGPLVDELAHVLGGSGVHTLVAENADNLADKAPDLAVAVGHFVLAPSLHSLWLRRDIPHLPVVFSDTGLTVGPMVEPGSGPCLLCLELHRRDADPAWPSVATQVFGRHGSAESALLAAEGAAVVARLVLERLAGAAAAASVSLRIDGATGERTTREWLPHVDCGCLGIEQLVGAAIGANAGADVGVDVAASRDRRGSGWAAAARRDPALG